MHIRDANESDKARCQALLALLNDSASEAAENVFDELLGQGRGQVIVAEHEGSIVGMATVSYNLAMRYGGEYCQLEELFRKGLDGSSFGPVHIVLLVNLVDRMDIERQQCAIGQSCGM